jgi:hypothetical protein
LRTCRAIGVVYAVVTRVENDRHTGDVGARVRAAALMIETSEQKVVTTSVAGVDRRVHGFTATTARAVGGE